MVCHSNQFNNEILPLKIVTCSLYYIGVCIWVVFILEAAQEYFVELFDSGFADCLNFVI